MPLRLTPAIKGFITSLAMIAAALLIDAKKENIDYRWQFAIYILYAIGIAWTLVPNRNIRFRELFSMGFRCFIVITLVMVAFTYTFIRLHPELAIEESQKVREYYLKEYKENKTSYTPDDIEKNAAKAKKQYAITVISISIFRYLVIGVVLTAAISALLIRRL